MLCCTGGDGAACCRLCRSRRAGCAKMSVNGAREEDLRDARGLLVLLRHGMSMWNRNPKAPEELWRYAGSSDVALAASGIEEALVAGERLSTIPVDIMFSSNLSRATNTGTIALSKHSSGKTPVVLDRNGQHSKAMETLEALSGKDAIMPVVCSDALNERNFGTLAGMPSTKHLEHFSHDFLLKVRHEWDVSFPGPEGESMEDVYNRVVPYFKQTIEPLLREGKNVLLCSHRFAICAIIKYIEDLGRKEFEHELSIEKSDPENCKLRVAPGVPLLYRYDSVSEKELPKKLGEFAQLH